jgi:hypothetical protein
MNYDISFPGVSNPTDNTATGGLGLDGGIYLTGTFSFDIDRDHNITTGHVDTQYGSKQTINGGNVDSSGTFTFTYGEEHLSASGTISRSRVHGTVCGSHALMCGSLVGRFTPHPTNVAQ